MHAAAAKIKLTVGSRMKSVVVALAPAPALSCLISHSLSDLICKTIQYGHLRMQTVE